jgi:tryptophan synthase alpha chain
MSVSARLARIRDEGRAALIGYLPLGFPDLATSIEALRAMVAGGADVVEIGLPYSDPLMDGPVIQDAVEASLRAGTRTADVFGAVGAVVDAGAPALVMSYWNLVLRYGVEAFGADLAAAGGSGLITPDLIPDEAEQWQRVGDRHGLDRVFLIAPSSTDARMARTATACRGFVYVASTMGVTGTRTVVSDTAQHLVARAREITDLPLCVGLGVSDAGQAAEVAAYADGVIVGSAFVRALAGPDGVAGVGELARSLADGVRAGR